MSEFDDFRLYSERGSIRYACMQIDAYSFACGYCQEVFVRNQPKACYRCGSRIVAKERGKNVPVPRSVDEKRDYLAKLELLKKNIEDMKARDNSYEQKYPSYGQIMDTFESAAARERQELETAKAAQWAQFADMETTYQQAMYGNFPPLDAVNAATMEAMKQAAAELKKYLFNGNSLRSQIEKPPEVISPLIQQNREILI